MSEVTPFIKFHQICYDAHVRIVGPLMRDQMIPSSRSRRKLVIIRMNKLVEGADCCDIWLDNGIGGFPFRSIPTLTLRAAHLGFRDQREMLFLSGLMSEDQLTFAPPEVLADNAWHRKLGFSPLAGVIALQKVCESGARRIEMLGMDLYGGDQAKAFAHDLKQNALYISYIARMDTRVFLCDELREAIFKITNG